MEVISPETEIRGLSENSMPGKTGTPSFDTASSEGIDVETGVVTDDTLGGLGDGVEEISSRTQRRGLSEN